MRHLFAASACLFLIAPTLRAEDIIFPDNTPASAWGGLMIIRRGDTTTWSLGGNVFRRHLKVVTATPQGPVVSRFITPSMLEGNNTPFYPQCAPAQLWVKVPDASSIVYVDGEKVPGRGTLRVLESPVLRPGRSYPVMVRVASIIGENLVVEDKQILLRAGDNLSTTFDGTGALTVPLSKIH